MTDLEKAVANALRLSDEAAADLLPTIQRNIATARAELIRSGVSEEVAKQEGHVLVEDFIITFCLYKMGSEEERDRTLEALKYQQENLRKS